MKGYYRVMLGQRSLHAAEGFAGTPTIDFYRYQVSFKLLKA